MKNLFKGLILFVYLPIVIFSFAACEKDIPEETYNVTVFSYPKSQLSKFLNINPEEFKSPYSKSISKTESRIIKQNIENYQEYEWTQSEIEEWMLNLFDSLTEGEKKIYARQNALELISFTNGYIIILKNENVHVILKENSMDIEVSENDISSITNGSTSTDTKKSK